MCNSISSCLHLTASSLSSTLQKRRSLKHFVYLKYVLQNECLSAIILLSTKNLFLSNIFRTKSKKNPSLCLYITLSYPATLYNKTTKFCKSFVFLSSLFFLVMRFCCYKNFSSFMPWRISLCPEHSGLL